MKKLWIPALAALAVAALMSPSAAFGAVTFPDGVSSGDVTQSRAILWTRVAWMKPSAWRPFTSTVTPSLRLVNESGRSPCAVNVVAASPRI